MSRSALIIGGSRGGGRALTLKWARAGRAVLVLSRHPPDAKFRPVDGVQYLLADLNERENLLKALSVLFRDAPLGDLVFFQRFRGGGDPWAGELETTLTATKTVIEAVSDKFANGSAVVIVGSAIGRFVADEASLGYHVAKAGLEEMVRYYAVHLATKGVRVNGISPSAFEKEESRAFWGAEELKELYKKIVPLGRIGTSTELAEVISFLCSPQASYITGQNIVVDGGFSLIWQESLARRLVLKNQAGK